MALNKTQFSSIVIAALAFSILYFGCDTKSDNLKKANQTRSLNMEATSIQNILLDVKKTLTKEEKSLVEALNVELNKANSDETKVDLSMLRSTLVSSEFALLSSTFKASTKDFSSFVRVFLTSNNIF